MNSPAQLRAALARFPRAPLGHLPTPLDPAPRLGASLGIRLDIKRDDCTGLALGGNKVRQLEYYLGRARAQSADTVLITGAVQSNFVRVAAAAARKLGMDIHIQLEERVGDVDANYRQSGNVLLDRLLGAHIHPFAVGEDEAGADRRLEEIAAELRAKGARPYVIHLSVDYPPTGALGYVQAAAETVEQSSPERRPQAYVVPTGSGLTHAGFLVGLRLCGVDAPVHGICVRRDAAAQRTRILRRVREIESLLGVEEVVSDDDVRIDDTSLAPGYGKLNEATYRAIDRAARLEGLLLDPVYSAKTLAGLEALIAAEHIPPDAEVVFVHTGGQPALFGYQGALEPYLRAAAPT